MVSKRLRPALAALAITGCSLLSAADKSANTGDTAQGVALTGEGRDSGRRVRLGGVMVSAGYSYSSGFYPYYGLYQPWGWGPYAYAWPYWGFYDPFWYGPMFSPMFYTSAVPGMLLGEVKLDTPVKAAAVYLDDAYAGTVKDLKTLWLQPGVYRLRVEDGDGRSFERKVYVLTGKTLKLRPEFHMAAKEQKP